jgi:hypothetical protein
MPEMNTGFQHLTHRDRHYYTPLSGLSLDPLLGLSVQSTKGTLMVRICEFARIVEFWPEDLAAPPALDGLPIQANVRF